MNRLKCPKCNYRIYVSVLCSNPEQYEAYCCKCNFELRYFEREKSGNKIMQEELNAKSKDVVEND
jgi:hypothetical protein